MPRLTACELVFQGDERDAIVSKLAEDRALAGLDPVTTNYLDPVFLNNTEVGRVQINDYLSHKMNEGAVGKDGEFELSISLAGVTLEVQERGGLPLSSATLRIVIDHEEGPTFRTAADSIAALILEAAGQESVVWEHDLEHFVVCNDGVVRERDERGT